MASTITNERYVNFKITDAQGYSRTFKINNVISDQTQLQTALKNFGDNFVMDDEKNILITGRTAEGLIGYSADLVVTEKTEDIVTGGEQYPLIVTPQEVTFSSTGGNQSQTVAITNATGNVTTTYVTGQSGTVFNPSFNWSSQTGLLTLSYTSMQQKPPDGTISAYKVVDEDGKTGFFTILIAG